ncbi:hypothetical protein K0T92_19555 [Paenibacillus oenotherae]|uniref:Uncharacterized protein n=1 Tax=Paenibacillus oenotherae TaxID=1435645 RepID=A0ABS7DCN6_9BACL|nr:hypothetical protein [Paenibacillus oenotherae]MBW7476918.1 hypothetical protein [Paenibacillus oenotherae]
MKWLTLMEHHLISLRMDREDRSLIVEVNDGGMSPEYVTARLQAQDVEQLVAALLEFNERIQSESSGD